MADPTFDVFFDGMLVPGADVEQVRANLAKLFKTEPARLGHLFAGQRVAIKKGVDQATAANYRAAMAKAGAIVEVVPAGAAVAPRPAAAAPAPAPREPDVNTGALEGSAAAHGSPLAAAMAAAPAPAPTRAPSAATPTPAAPVAPVVPPQAPDFTVAEVGAILVEQPEFRPANIATDHLSVAAVGAILSDAKPPPEPQFDLSAFNLAPVGAVLSDAQPVPEPQFDLSGLKLAE